MGKSNNNLPVPQMQNVDQSIRETAEEYVRLLREQRADILAYLRDYDELVRQAEQAVQTFVERRHLGKPDAHRTTHAESRRLRQQAASDIYEFLAGQKGQQFGKQDLLHLVPQHQRSYWVRILAEHNKRNPKQQIKHNGGGTAARRYFVP